MILLDTHAFVWWVSDPDQLSQSARKAIEGNSGSLAVSIVTAWEIALLEKKQRLELPLPADVFMERALKHYGIHELALRRETVLKAVSLPDIHNDPFDRVLISEALLGKMKLVTKDSQIAKYPDIKVIW